MGGEEIFVANLRNHRLQVFALDGTYRRQWDTRGQGDGQIKKPSGVWMCDKEVFVSDQGNHRIQAFGIDGTYRR